MEKLENKTKAQLLDIIDRKDRIECELRDINKTLNNKIERLDFRNKEYKREYNAIKNDIIGTEKVLNKTREELDWYKKEYDKTTEIKTEYERYKNEYENICDILATERIDYKSSRYAYIVTLIILFICLVFSIIIKS